MLVQDELTTREQVIHQNNLIMQREDYVRSNLAIHLSDTPFAIW